MKPPASTSGASVGETKITPATPIASAPPRPPTASATRVRRESWVPSGRPWSSSRQWAPTPTARKKATIAAASRPG